MDWANAYVPLDDDQKDSWRDLFVWKICYTVVLAVHHGIFDKDLLKLALAAHSCMNFSALMQQYILNHCGLVTFAVKMTVGAPGWPAALSIRCIQ